MVANPGQDNSSSTSKNYQIKIYSIGAGNEKHGPALPASIDDYFGRRTAVLVSELIGADYKGHFPYSGDRVGEIAKDWNLWYMDEKDVIDGIINDVMVDISKLEEHGLGGFSHVVIISGHGGNNFLKDKEGLLLDHIGVPTLYVPPFDGVVVNHPKYGDVITTHADDGEHSIALYMGLLNMAAFERINKMAKDPLEVLKKWPALMGLGGYVLPELGGDKYRALRDPQLGLLEKAKEFIKYKRIIANEEIGRKLFERNIEVTREKIKKFLIDYPLL